MKSFIYVCLLLCTISSYGQTLSKTKILLTDVTIPIKYELDGKTLVLNRVLLVKSNKEKENKELIEWIKGKMFFYKLRSTSSIQ